MRKNIVAGNWKMNTNADEAISLAKEIAELNSNTTTEVIVIPPFVHLTNVNNAIKGTTVKLGAQNCHQAASGAYTGEISAGMLKSVDCTYVTLGHSERREYFGETNDLLAAKVNIALANHLKPIYCCGETLEQREADKHFEIIGAQVSEGLFHLTAEELKNTVIAYEPVWAIGTGVTASAAQAQEVHAFIRKQLTDKYGADVASEISILYGGSVKPDNAKELFNETDIDGGLIGGASLKATDFTAIINAF